MGEAPVTGASILSHQPLTEKRTLGWIPSQLQRPAVCREGLGRPAHPAQQLGPGGVEQVVAIEAGDEGLHLTQGGLRAQNVAQRDRPVQPDHRRGRKLDEFLVEERDLVPVGLRPGRSFGMAGGDGGLQLERPRPSQP